MEITGYEGRNAAGQGQRQQSTPRPHRGRLPIPFLIFTAGDCHPERRPAPSPATPTTTLQRLSFRGAAEESRPPPRDKKHKKRAAQLE
jgi:hypothetical protein